MPSQFIRRHCLTPHPATCRPPGRIPGINAADRQQRDCVANQGRYHPAATVPAARDVPRYAERPGFSRTFLEHRRTRQKVADSRAQKLP